VVLESGALSIRVDHSASPRRLLVLLPDGELEDIGTTFSVSVADGHTTRVTVQDGSVVLRLRGKPPLALGAGDAWSPAPREVALPAVSSTSKPPAVRAKAAPSAAPAVSSSASTSADTGASAEFRVAMSAFNGGEHPRAAALFSRFLAQHPGDLRAEDAAYLRILALQRTGDAPATKEAARDYLSRYPHGFRQAEAAALAR